METLTYANKSSTDVQRSEQSYTYGYMDMGEGRLGTAAHTAAPMTWAQTTGGGLDDMYI